MQCNSYNFFWRCCIEALTNYRDRNIPLTLAKLQVDVWKHEKETHCQPMARLKKHKRINNANTEQVKSHRPQIKNSINNLSSYGNVHSGHIFYPYWAHHFEFFLSSFSGTTIPCFHTIHLGFDVHNLKSDWFSIWGIFWWYWFPNLELSQTHLKC